MQTGCCMSNSKSVLTYLRVYVDACFVHGGHSVDNTDLDSASFIMYVHEYLWSKHCVLFIDC